MQKAGLLEGDKGDYPSYWLYGKLSRADIKAGQHLDVRHTPGKR